MTFARGTALWLSSALLLATGCATTGATLGSGVGDALLEHPPYYAGQRLSAMEAEATRIGHLPVAYQRGASQPAIFDPAEAGPVRDLLANMNRYLDSLGVSTRLVEGDRLSAVAQAATRVPPDVRFGCITESGMPDDDCAERDNREVLGREGQWMQLSVGRPSAAWAGWLGGVMDEVGVDRTLVVSLEVGQYLPRQRGLTGSKYVELGTDHEQPLPWLTSLETPVTVLQLTGALVDREGKAIRIGAEGLLARRTNLLLSAAGAQALITEEEVRQLLSARREDRPGGPLVWQEALRALMGQLTWKAIPTP